MLKLLLLIGFGAGGYVLAKRVMQRSNAVPDGDDFYGSADIHRAADQAPSV